jgi:non-homologous end joining protein Ku
MLPEILSAIGMVEAINAGRAPLPFLAHTKDWSTSMIKDPVQNALLDLIASKVKVTRSTAKSAKRKTGNVIDLMAVLKKSLEHA